MNQRKSKLIKWLTGIALCAALLTTVSTVGVANATTTLNESDYTLVMNGASIRLDENYGIRFKATANAVRQDSKYYMMIVPDSWYTDTAHDLQNAENGDYYQHLTDVKNLKPMEDFITMQSTPEKKGNVYEIKGSLSNVHFTNSNTKFFGIAYEELADGTRKYAARNDESVRSICYVAGAALNDESANFDSTIKEKLMDTVNDAYDVSLGNTEDTGAELDLSSTGFKQNSVYTLDKGSVTALEMASVPTIDLPIEYSVAAGSGTPCTITKDGVLTVNDETGYSFVKAQIAGETRNLTVYHTPQMAEGMLNDFAASQSGRTYDMNLYGTDISGGRGYWHNEKADAYGNKGYGVGSVANSSEARGVRFNVSKAELKAMDIDTITIRFLIEVADASVKNLSLTFFFTPEISNPGGIFKSYPVNTWSYYTINKTTDESAWETFMDTYCNSGVGRTASNKGGFQLYSGTATLYIDYISVGTQRMAEHELENFDTSAARYNHSGSLTDFNQNTSTYIESKTDSAGVTARGVASAQIWYSNGVLITRFGRTEAELLKIMKNLDTLTVRLLITRAETDTEWHFKVFGVQKLIPTNTWVDFTVTRDEILAAITGETEDAKIAQFASNFCSTGLAYSPRMLGSACQGTSVQVYLDSFTYTVKTAEAAE